MHVAAAVEDVLGRSAPLPLTEVHRVVNAQYGLSVTPQAVEQAILRLYRLHIVEYQERPLRRNGRPHRPGRKPRVLRHWRRPSVDCAEIQCTKRCCIEVPA